MDKAPRKEQLAKALAARSAPDQRYATRRELAEAKLALAVTRYRRADYVPAYGLMVAYRAYRCTCCGHIKQQQTNHTGTCAAYCPSCSWKPSAYPIAMHWDGRAYRAFEYAGGAILDSEINPYARSAAHG